MATAATPRRVTPLVQGDRVVVIGAGPAGLTAAYLLSQQGYRVTVLEADNIVGGISRTAQYKGYRFDIGGHRFFTKMPAVQALWEELLASEFISVPRLSRIHYGGKYFDYPLKPSNALRGLGVINAVQIVWSYLRARFRPSPIEANFEQWVTNRFGKRLYQIFFKTYTEKVWGIPCTEIRAEWAAQRIQGLSLASAIMSAATLTKRSTKIKSLISEFQYPRLGPGQMWEAARDRIEAMGNRVLMSTCASAIECEADPLTGERRVTGVRATTLGGEQRFPAEHVISTMPVRSLVRALTPPVSPETRRAAEGLRYRDFLVVALILEGEDLFPDTWIYIHTPGVQVGRIQNFNNWSKAMVPDPGRTCLGLEYFCFEGDGLWSSTDEELVALATRELKQLNLARHINVVDGTVVRMPKAYPIYDAEYRACLDKVRETIDPIPNLHTVGRNGMHKYNNQDHSMLTAMMAVWNMQGAQHDSWAENTDFEYHEEQKLDPPGPEPAAAPGSSGPMPPLSVVVPAHQAARLLPVTLGALAESDFPRSEWELTVVDDASADGTSAVAARWADQVLTLPGAPRGPGFARNRGVEVSRGEWVVFIDADVRVHPDTLRRFAEAIIRDPGMDALFGAYDDAPPAPGFLSRYRNLLHRYVHLASAGETDTFWGGCGAVRRSAFLAAGGFNEVRYPRPQIEDIELGYRLRDQGCRILIRPEIQAAHLKRWTFLAGLRTDVLDRGIPWVRLLLERGRLAQPANLSLKRGEPLKTALVGLGLLLLVLAAVTGRWPLLAGAGVMLGAVVASNHALLRWFARERGVRFALAVIPLNLLHYLVSGVAVAAGLALHLLHGRPRAEPPAALTAREAAADGVGFTGEGRR